MGNMTELRDHSQPCEHVGDGAYYSNIAGCWLCDFMIGEFSETLCPGGKKIEVMRIGWCPRGGGHTDMPEPDDPVYGECGSKWRYEALMTPWKEVEEY